MDHDLGERVYHRKMTRRTPPVGPMRNQINPTGVGQRGPLWNPVGVQTGSQPQAGDADGAEAERTQPAAYAAGPNLPFLCSGMVA